MRQNKLSFYCFSPAVMIATFIFETVAALILLLRYRRTIEIKLIIAILICLAIFQLAEYMICVTAFGLSSLDWSRIGWISISFLPPLGVHLGLAISRKKLPVVKWLGYAVAVVFSLCFLTVGHGIQSSECMGNYVIFEVAKPVLGIYIAYYYVWLAAGMTAAFIYARDIKQKKRRQALRWLSAGYASFIVPTIAANLLDPATLSAIPSVMCGFAVILAAVLLFIVAPRVGELRKSK